MAVNKTGRVPKPTALKLLHGERPGRINTNEPIPEAGLPTCPEQACDDVREIWEYTVRQLDKMGCVSLADRDALYVYCEAVNLHRQTSAAMNEVRANYSGPTAARAQYELAKIQRPAGDTIKNLGAHFGLTPSSRSSIQVGERPNDAMGPERYLSA